MAINFVSCCCPGKHILCDYTTFSAFCAFLSCVSETQLDEWSDIYWSRRNVENMQSVVIPSLCKSANEDIYFFADFPFFFYFSSILSFLLLFAFLHPLNPKRYLSGSIAAPSSKEIKIWNLHGETTSFPAPNRYFLATSWNFSKLENKFAQQILLLKNMSMSLINENFIWVHSYWCRRSTFWGKNLSFYTYDNGKR